MLRRHRLESDYRRDRPLHSIEDEEGEVTIHGASYKGLFHGWECPECGEFSFEEEGCDPREIGIFVSCKNCGWEGRVED